MSISLPLVVSVDLLVHTGHIAHGQSASNVEKRSSQAGNIDVCRVQNLLCLPQLIGYLKISYLLQLKQFEEDFYEGIE